MVRFRVMSAMALKKLVESISTISKQALIAFSEEEVRIAVSGGRKEIDALLKIDAKGFFDEYDCTRPLVVRVDIWRLSYFLSSAKDDDQVHVNLKDDESPVSLLEIQIHVHNSSINEKRVAELKAPETQGDNLVMTEEADYEFEVSVRCKYFNRIIKRSGRLMKPVQISVTRRAVKIGSGGKRFKLIEKVHANACKLEKVPSDHKLELSLYPHAKTISFACTLSSTVKIRFLTVTCASPHGPHPSFEFPISEFSKLCFYFPRRSSRPVFFASVLKALTLKQLVTPSALLLDSALIEFSDSRVVIANGHKRTNIYHVLKIDAGFFSEFRCRRALRVRVNLLTLACILSNIQDDHDQVCIFINDENPITRLGCHIHNSKTKKNVTAEMEVKVKETSFELIQFNEELNYEYVLAISPRHFGNIMAYSARWYKYLTISVAGNSVTLSTGSESVTLSADVMADQCIMYSAKNWPPFKVPLPLHRIAKTIIRSCGIADTVKLRHFARLDRHVGPPTLLEFPVGSFSKFMFYFPRLYR